MHATPESPIARAWSRIEAEQRSDRLFRRLTIVGWIATGLVVVLLIAFGVAQFRWALQLSAGGAAPLGALLAALVPVILAVGAFCALGATLATIGLFLRMRSAPLHEIQLRLAALEDLLTQTASARESR
ncbi:MAG: hypothetical protein KF689_02575 [Gemmatimonadaceae bacterium]|nr:hypothetical protein [Gemmatimonadaceae bacterium]MCW5826822.1 hypothetical protein [Gemmatimonadaceae bacterium]